MLVLQSRCEEGCAQSVRVRYCYLKFSLRPYAARETGAGGDKSVEFVAAGARVGPLVAERGINPAESRTAGRRAALFSRQRSMSKRTPLHPKQIIASSRTPPQASGEVFPGIYNLFAG